LRASATASPRPSTTNIATNNAVRFRMTGFPFLKLRSTASFN
jgi:hypothetical protein